jgi:hypothetical protein
MKNSHITIFVEMSDEDKHIEQKLIQEKKEVSKKIDLAIKQHESIKELQDLEMKLHCSIRDLKGGVYADQGQRLPRDSQELAQSLLLKANKVAHLEINYINSLLAKYRNEMTLIKDRIENIIAVSIENELDKKFDDFNLAINFWDSVKADVFEKPERCEPSFGGSNLPMIANNLIGYYIKKIWALQFSIGDFNENKKNRTQVQELITSCERVIRSTDDNLIFDEIFLMGQRAGNLNNIETNINTIIAKDRSQREAFSKSDWAHELAKILYLEHWIHNDYPSTYTVMAELESGKYRHLKADNKKLDKYGEKLPKVHEKTMERVMREQRLLYSKIDPRITLPQKGRPKKK